MHRLRVLRPRAYRAVAGVGVQGGHNLRDGFGSVDTESTIDFFFAEFGF